MELIFIDNLNSKLNISNNVIASIGEFDGLHLAHQKLIFETIRLAKDNNCLSALITFDPHPDYVLGKRRNEGYITPFNQKVKILSNYGLDYLIVIKFSIEVMNLNKEDFFNYFLKDLKGLVVGYDFKFAYKALGDVKYLKQKFEGKVFKEIAKVECFNENNELIKVGSDNIRVLLKKGNVIEANKLLNRSFSYLGIVQEGKKIGRELGFKTANIILNEENIKIKKGVYIVKSNINGKVYYGIANYGNNPTCNFVSNARLEVHFLDFDLDIYGIELEVELIKFIRDEKKFDSVNDLIMQINADKEEAIKYRGSL